MGLKEKQKPGSLGEKKHSGREKTFWRGVTTPREQGPLHEGIKVKETCFGELRSGEGGDDFVKEIKKAKQRKKSQYCRRRGANAGLRHKGVTWISAACPQQRQQHHPPKESPIQEKVVW